jgi:uncharacterized protein GlcG (DUF336 family)
MTTLTLSLARQIADAVEARARTAGLAVSVCVMDPHGNLVLHERMDGASLASVEVSLRKAYTAVALGTATGDITDATLPGGPMFGLNMVSAGRYVSWGGGTPFRADGVIIGAVGVSGASSAEDMDLGTGAIADAGLA